MNLLRSFDPDVARQKLRSLLLELAPDDHSSVPYSFAVDELLEYALKRLRSRAPLLRERRLEVLVTVGTALSRHTRDTESLACLSRALKVAETPQQRARIHYVIGHEVHQRQGNWKAAIEELREAIDVSPVASTTRALAWLGLATSYVRIGRTEDGEDAAFGALSSGIRDIEPHARIRLATVRWKQGRTDEAVREHAVARDLFRADGSIHGMAAVDANLGAMYLELRDATKALPLLVRARQTHLEYLDIARLGKSYHNEGMALLQLDRTDEAMTALLNAMRYHAESGRLANLAGSLTTLGNILDARGDPEMALCSLERAREVAAGIESRSGEFAALGAMLHIVASRKIHLGAVPYLLSKAGAVLDNAGSSLPQSHLANFAVLTLELARLRARMPTRKLIARPARFPLPAYRAEFDRVLAPYATARLEDLLSQRISSVMTAKHAPEPRTLGAFLLGWAGRTFKNADYQEEFRIPRQISRYHLAILRDNRIIGQLGTRKAAHYKLSFHLSAQVGASAS